MKWTSGRRSPRTRVPKSIDQLKIEPSPKVRIFINLEETSMSFTRRYLLTIGVAKNLSKANQVAGGVAAPYGPAR
jgi:hypothetical protein